LECRKLGTSSKLQLPDKISQIIFMDSVREAAVEGKRRLELPSPSLEVALRQAMSLMLPVVCDFVITA